MRAIRLVLTQSSANYKRNECVTNKMTYPLPPISTVIGAIHNACNYKEYHEMDLSIQGNFVSMHKEPYTDQCFFNSIQDDRGILVKLKNSYGLSFSFDKVASSIKTQGNSFRKGITIRTHNNELLKEYRELKNLKDKIDLYKKNEYKEKLENFKVLKSQLSLQKKSFDKKSEDFSKISEEEKKVKQEEKLFKDNVKDYEVKNYEEKISRFKSLVTSIKYYEILNEINLIIHIKSDEKTLSDIKENIYNLKSIGRSEDFVHVVECELVDLEQDSELEGNIVSNYNAYLNYDDIKNENIFFSNIKIGQSVNGTKYYLNKKYEIINKKRIFEKKKVIYSSQYGVDSFNENIYIDKSNDEAYIVNFI